MSGDETPRLVYDPEFGATALEFRRHKGIHLNCLDRRTIYGCYVSDLHDKDSGKIIARDVCVLSTADGAIPLDHDYGEIRDLLFPMQKEGVF